jgi:3-deoxy-D-manno-octulosonic-acid transferase
VITLYRILFPVIALILSPYYVRRMLRRGGYGQKLAYRFGNWPRLAPKKTGNKRIWIQAVSVGEASSLSKILPSLSRMENTEVILSGTTSTGLSYADKKFGDYLLANGPFPLDWFPFSKKAWDRIDPDLVIMVDSELWPEHFEQAHLRNVPILIINARLSDRSFARLQKFKAFHKLVFPSNLSVITASERQAKRWLMLGFDEKNIFPSGNLKIDAVSKKPFGSLEKKQLIEEFGFDENSIILAGISTWHKEEKLLVEIVQSLRLEGIDVRLLLIPRHAERRRDVIKTLQTCQLPFHVRTQGKKAESGNIVYLADTTGELAWLIRVAAFAFMGKTLPPNHGGQNPIEPIAFGIPLVVGPNYQNFRETCHDMFLHHAAIESKDASDVTRQLMILAKDRKIREKAGNACKNWIQKQGSPSEFTLNTIEQILGR